MKQTLNSELSILFIGSVIPVTDEFLTPAFGFSGQLVQEGIIKGIQKQGIKIEIVSTRPMPAYPNYDKIICKRKKSTFSDTIKIVFLPFINLLLLREFCQGIFVVFEIIRWALQNRNKKRCIIQYGVYSPPVLFVYLGAIFSRSGVFGILYDLGLPPKNLNLGSIRYNIYRVIDFFAKTFIPKMQGRIVINENVIKDYAKGQPCLLLDGGVSELVISKLFDLNNQADMSEKFVFLFAGTLWPINGTRLILEAMQLNQNPNISVLVAGKGMDADLFLKAQETDPRIKYLGGLDMDQLFVYYQKADALLNLRVSTDGDCDYFFPSKFFEYLVTGRYIITTSIHHLERDYGKYCKVLENDTAAYLSNILNEVSNTEKELLIQKGKSARDFMLSQKTWDLQSIKIVNYLQESF